MSPVHVDPEPGGFWSEVKEIFFGELMFRALLLISAILAGFIVGLYVSGCAPAPHVSPLVNGVSIAHNPVAPIVNHLVATSHPFVASVIQSTPAVVRSVTSVPPDLKPVARWTNFLVILGILAVGVAASLYFLEATLHKIAVSLGAGGIALASYSLFVHTTLWLAPYVSGGLLLTAIGLIVYEALRNKDAINAKVTSEISPTPAPTKVPPFPDLATRVKTVVPVSVHLPSAQVSSGSITSLPGEIAGKVEGAITDLEKKL